MDFMKMWKKNKKIVVAAGFVVGLLYVLDFLPVTIDLLGDYTLFAYGGVIAFSGFTFYKFYWNLGSGVRVAQPSYDKYVPRRDLNNPKYTDDVLRSGGVDPSSVKGSDKREDFIMPDEDRRAQRSKNRSGEVFDKFKQDY